MSQIYTTFATPPPRDVYTTISGGSWVNALNWDVGVAPDNNQTDGNDDIIITHHITLTDDLTVKSGTNITVTGCDTLHVTGNVTFNNGSSILVEPCAVLIIDGNLTNNNNSIDVVINGEVIVGGNYDGGNGSQLGGSGSMDIEGTVTTDGDATVFGSETDCTVDCDNSADNPLPIELVFFIGEVYDNTIRLQWLTASEINNDYFEIYKLDDITWGIIGKVSGAGNSSSPIMYSWMDTIPNEGNNLYKLKQVDYDGESEEFKIINVVYEIRFYDRRMIIYPNPSTSNEDVNVELIGFSGEEILIVVMDITGQVFYEKAVMSKQDNVLIVLDSKLSKGTYLVVGSTKQELYKKKLIIR
jgi:hypothetical protein